MMSVCVSLCSSVHRLVAGGGYVTAAANRLLLLAARRCCLSMAAGSGSDLAVSSRLGSGCSATPEAKKAHEGKSVIWSINFRTFERNQQYQADKL